MRFMAGIITLACFAWLGNAEEPVLRIRATKQDRTLHGIAIPVNLAEFGIPGDGYALTCAHLCDDDRTLSADGIKETIAFKVIAKDEGFDVALIKSSVALTDRPFRLSRLSEPPRLATFFGACHTDATFTTEAIFKESDGFKWIFHCERFNLGGSGSAIIYKGEIIAMATHCLAINGTPIDGGASCLPARRIRQFIKEYAEK